LVSPDSAYILAVKSYVGRAVCLAKQRAWLNNGGGLPLCKEVSNELAKTGKHFKICRVGPDFGHVKKSVSGIR